MKKTYRDKNLKVHISFHQIFTTYNSVNIIFDFQLGAQDTQGVAKKNYEMKQNKKK